MADQPPKRRKKEDKKEEKEKRAFSLELGSPRSLNRLLLCLRPFIEEVTFSYRDGKLRSVTYDNSKTLMVVTHLQCTGAAADPIRLSVASLYGITKSMPASERVTMRESDDKKLQLFVHGLSIRGSKLRMVSINMLEPPPNLEKVPDISFDFALTLRTTDLKCMFEKDSKAKFARFRIFRDRHDPADVYLIANVYKDSTDDEVCLPGRVEDEDEEEGEIKKAEGGELRIDFVNAVFCAPVMEEQEGQEGQVPSRKDVEELSNSVFNVLSLCGMCSGLRTPTVVLRLSRDAFHRWLSTRPLTAGDPACAAFSRPPACRT